MSPCDGINHGGYRPPVDMSGSKHEVLVWFVLFSEIRGGQTATMDTNFDSKEHRSSRWTESVEAHLIEEKNSKLKMNRIIQSHVCRSPIASNSLLKQRFKNGKNLMQLFYDLLTINIISSS